MKNIILKTPYLLFFLVANSAILVMALAAYRFIPIPSDVVLLLLILVQAIAMVLWYFSLTDFFSYESNSSETDVIIRVFAIASPVIAAIIRIELSEFPYLYLFPTVLHLALSILVYNKAKKVFYARSKWFLFLELFFTPIAMLTLSPEVQRWAKSEEARKH